MSDTHTQGSPFLDFREKYFEERERAIKAESRLAAAIAERDKWKSLAEKATEACQATYDYFIYLCKSYHGEKTKSGMRTVTFAKEIERLFCERAVKLCLETVALFENAGKK